MSESFIKKFVQPASIDVIFNRAIKPILGMSSKPISETREIIAFQMLHRALDVFNRRHANMITEPSKL